MAEVLVKEIPYNSLKLLRKVNYGHSYQYLQFVYEQNFFNRSIFYKKEKEKKIKRN